MFPPFAASALPIVIEASPAELSKTLLHLLVHMGDVPLAHMDSTGAHTGGGQGGVLQSCVQKLSVQREYHPLCKDGEGDVRSHHHRHPNVLESRWELDPLFGSTSATWWCPVVRQAYPG